jgi:hypothetical protein
LVDKRTMRVIDGMHRLMAAALRGMETIDAVFFEGSEADIFLRAVQENVTHGLPLSQADRRAATQRIIASYPHMSDRAIAQCVGLGAKTVGAIRKRSAADVAKSNVRLGRDGKIRPLDGSEGRRLAAELLTRQPTASVREIARGAGISPATVLDVRRRIERGESPVPGRASEVGSSVDADASRGGNTGAAHGPSAAGGSPRPTSPGPQSADQAATGVTPARTVEKLLRDPSLRGSEEGRHMLRMLQTNAAGLESLPRVAAAVPPHCVGIVVELARQYARMWLDFTRELDRRARLVDRAAASRPVRLAGAIGEKRLVPALGIMGW